MIRSRTVVLIQSRLASSRLPAKAMLPVAGFPTVVLCALRAANAGLRVVVATSDTDADDVIVNALGTVGISCFRGAHLDVLLRFAQATRELPDDGVVVRLTADNVFPDGSFVESVLQEFARRELDYIGAGLPQDGLPYGMSVEVFTVAALRRAEREARSPLEREHVTPWIKRHCSAGRYVYPERHPHWSRLRCTLDNYDDYSLLVRVFAECDDPTRIGWRALVDRLTSLSLSGSEPRCPFRERSDGTIHSVLTLGTAQLGSNYGIANATGMPGDSEVGTILARTADAGITAIDTASVYGIAEERIGRLLPPNFVDRIQVTTKLNPLADVPADASADTVRNAVDASVFKSLHRLRRRGLDTLLLHRWAHHDAWRGAAWARLVELKREGLIGTLGASVSYPKEAMEALADPEVGQLQCPVNLLDSRWRDAEFLARVATRPDVVIHARSVLLQGMLTLPAARWVQVPGVDAQQVCDTLDGLVVELGRVDRVDLCMAYTAALPWVTSLVVGVESLEQLRVNLGRAQAPSLSAEELVIVAAKIPALPETLVNPALWRPAHA